MFVKYIIDKFNNKAIDKEATNAFIGKELGAAVDLDPITLIF